MTEEQAALAEVAAGIFADAVTPERLAALAASAEPDLDAWAALAEAGVLGAVVPPAHGGSGLGLGALVGVLEAAGRALTPAPLVQTLVLGVLPLVEFGTEAQQQALLPGVADGSIILTAALEDPHASAQEHEGAWSLSGDLGPVAYAAHATRVLVAAQAGDDVAVFLVDPAGEGAMTARERTTNLQPTASLVLERAHGALLARGSKALRWIQERGAAAVCVVVAGACDQALQMTAAHTASRRQFDKPIAEFQAVAQRAADAFIDAQMVRLTAWQALYRLDQGVAASNEVHVAKFWAGDGGMRVVHAAQHLHGGLGVDLSYPLHRYFLWVKQLEHTLGTPTRELLRLGSALADEAV